MPVDGKHIKGNNLGFPNQEVIKRLSHKESGSKLFHIFNFQCYHFTFSRILSAFHSPIADRSLIGTILP